MLIDQYGFEAVSEFYRRRKLQAYKICTNGNVTYLCFHDTPRRAIHRITENGNEITVEWALGEWENREILEYVPINQPLEDGR